MTQKDIEDYSANPTEAKARKIQEAIDECVHCQNLVNVYKNKK